MEGNKDDAIKCFKIAQRALSSGYHEKAIRFLNKSIKLYPTKAAKDLLTELNSDSKPSKPKKHSSAATNGTSGNHGTFSKSNGKTDSKNEIEKEYSADQLEAVKRVKKSSDYYEVLGVDKECGESELKKAYRKLALQLHPDKNKAPGSTDAFKAVGKAFGVLSDTEKREQYNMYGESGQPTNRPQYRYSNMYDDGDIDPDEIFRMFFNGGFPGDNVRVYRRGNSYFYSNRSHNNNQQHHGNQSVAAWIQFMPLLILLIITMFSNLLVSDPPYSLVRRGDYIYQRDTPKFQVKYFVKSNFDQEYKGSDLRRLQSRVEDEYVEYLRGSCYQERVNKEHMRRRAVYLSSKDLLTRAAEMKTPSCDELEQLFNRA